MVTVPAATPVTTPVVALIVATDVLLLDHVPLAPSKYFTTTIPEPPSPPLFPA